MKNTPKQIIKAVGWGLLLIALIPVVTVASFVCVVSSFIYEINK
jgi:hypothetical protein